MKISGGGISTFIRRETSAQKNKFFHKGETSKNVRQTNGSYSSAACIVQPLVKPILCTFEFLKEEIA